MKIGMFLPSVILVSVAMLFKGLGEWVTAGWVCEISEASLKDNEAKKPSPAKGTWRNRRRPLLSALIVVVTTHVIGVLVFNLVCSRWFAEYPSVCCLITCQCYALTPSVS